jgi:hypothetical protein
VVQSLQHSTQAMRWLKNQLHEPSTSCALSCARCMLRCILNPFMLHGKATFLARDMHACASAS